MILRTQRVSIVVWGKISSPIIAVLFIRFFVSYTNICYSTSTARKNIFWIAKITLIERKRYKRKAWCMVSAFCNVALRTYSFSSTEEIYKILILKQKKTYFNILSKHIICSRRDECLNWSGVLCLKRSEENPLSCWISLTHGYFKDMRWWWEQFKISKLQLAYLKEVKMKIYTFVLITV